MNQTIQYSGDENRDPETIANAGSKPIERPTPIICVDDIAYVMFEKPDLDKQAAFLEDFGMQRISAEGDCAYFRGNGPSPWFYSARKGSTSRFLGAGYIAKQAEDLETLSAATGIPIEPIAEPGGGNRVRLKDPDGFIVDVVHGREVATRIPYRDETFLFNTPGTKPRVNERVSSSCRALPARAAWALCTCGDGFSHQPPVVYAPSRCHPYRRTNRERRLTRAGI